MAKLQISIRISDTGKEILDTLQDQLGITQAAIFELALRELAKKQGLELPGTKRSTSDMVSGS